MSTHANYSEAETNDQTTISGDVHRETPPTTEFPQTATPIQSSTESLIVLSHLGVPPQPYNLIFSAELNITTTNPMNTTHLPLNSFQKLLGSTSTLSRLAPLLTIRLSPYIWWETEHFPSSLSLCYPQDPVSKSCHLSGCQPSPEAIPPPVCSTLTSRWTIAMASKPVSLFWAFLTSVFPPHTSCWRYLPKAWT